MTLAMVNMSLGRHGTMKGGQCEPNVGWSTKPVGFYIHQ